MFGILPGTLGVRKLNPVKVLPAFKPEQKANDMRLLIRMAQDYDPNQTADQKHRELSDLMPWANPLFSGGEFSSHFTGK